MTEVVLAVAVGVGTLTLVLGLTGGWDADRRRVRRRLAGEFGEAGGSASPSPLYKDRDRLHTELAEDEQEVTPAGFARRLAAFERRLAVLLERAGSKITPRKLLIASAAAGLGLGLIAGSVGGPVVGAAVGAAGMVGPFSMLVAQARRRRLKYQTQLPGAFEMMSRALRAGQSVPEAFRAATESSAQPLAGEFGRCLHQIEHGLRPEVAYRELSERAGVVELRIFLVAMAVQRQTGGNLADVLDRLAGVVRSRVRVRQKIKALTAEGRMQSLTLTVLPAVTFAVMYLLNRPYAEGLLTRWQLLAATAACVAVGQLWIRKIMNFEG